MNSHALFRHWTYGTLAGASSSDTLAEAAVGLATATVAVFPCAAGGQEPLTPHGFRDAAADLRRVDSWWLQYPDARLGLPGGRVTAVEVVDIDLHGKASGLPSVERALHAQFVNAWVCGDGACTIAPPSRGRRDRAPVPGCQIQALLTHRKANTQLGAQHTEPDNGGTSVAHTLRFSAIVDKGAGRCAGCVPPCVPPRFVRRTPKPDRDAQEPYEPSRNRSCRLLGVRG